MKYDTIDNYKVEMTLVRLIPQLLQDQNLILKIKPVSTVIFRKIHLVFMRKIKLIEIMLKQFLKI